MFGAEGGIRTHEAEASDLQSAPFNHLDTSAYKLYHTSCCAGLIYGGEGGIRTHGAVTPCSFRDCCLKPTRPPHHMVCKEGFEPPELFTPSCFPSKYLQPLGHLTLLKSGKGGRNRTCDTRFWRPMLCQLSYTPILVTCGRVELPPQP